MKKTKISPHRPVKTYLQSIRSKRMEIKHLNDMLEELQTSLLPSGIRYDKVNVQHSVNPDPNLDVLEKIGKYEAKIRANLAELLEDYNAAYEMIMELERPEHRQVLYLYYLRSERITWETIAQEMKYSEQRIYQLHNEAIDILEQETRKRL